MLAQHIYKLAFKLQLSGIIVSNLPMAYHARLTPVLCSDASQ